MESLFNLPMEKPKEKTVKTIKSRRPEDKKCRFIIFACQLCLHWLSLRKKSRTVARAFYSCNLSNFALRIPPFSYVVYIR